MVSSCFRIRLWSQCVQTHYSQECFGCKRQKPSTDRKGKLLALFTKKLQWPNAPASSMAVSGHSDNVVISLSCPTLTYFLCIYFLFITLSHSDKDGISTSRLSFLLCQRSQQKYCASFSRVPRKVLRRALGLIFLIYKELLQIEKIFKIQ